MGGSNTRSRCQKHHLFDARPVEPTPFCSQPWSGEGGFDHRILGASERVSESSRLQTADQARPHGAPPRASLIVQQYLLGPLMIE